MTPPTRKWSQQAIRVRDHALEVYRQQGGLPTALEVVRHVEVSVNVARRVLYEMAEELGVPRPLARTARRRAPAVGWVESPQVAPSPPQMDPVVAPVGRATQEVVQAAARLLAAASAGQGVPGPARDVVTAACAPLLAPHPRPHVPPGEEREEECRAVVEHLVFRWQTPVSAEDVASVLTDRPARVATTLARGVASGWVERVGRGAESLFLLPVATGPVMTGGRLARVPTHGWDATLLLAAHVVADHLRGL